MPPSVFRKLRPSLVTALVATACLAVIAPAAEAGNLPPEISGTPPTSVAVGSSYLFRPTAADPEGKRLRFSIANKPKWASFSSSTGTLSGTPRATDVGVYAGIRIKVSDGKLKRSLSGFSITVRANGGNGAPRLSGTPPASASVGTAYEFRPSASDPDGDRLSFSITNKPAWAAFSTTTGRLSGTPTKAHVGTYANIVIRASDGSLAASLPAFSIVVTAAGNRPPTADGSPQATAPVGRAYSFRPDASDPDGDPLTFSIVGKPAWASFYPGSGRLYGTPKTADAGTYSGISIRVSDGLQTTTLPPFTITVPSANANNPPQISGTPPSSVNAGQTYSFTPTASDPDAGQALTFAIAGKPSWASFDNTTGRLWGTPTAAQVGYHVNIRISVSDGVASASLPAFTIQVAAAQNRAPSISGTPSTSVTAGQAYGFTPTASDPDAGQTLTFAISGKPAWANFSASTGRLSGTPTATHVGTYSNVRISVSDGTDSASLPAFSITVAAAQAGSATLSWKAPTLNTDGSPLTDLSGYKVYYGTRSRQYDQSLQVPSASITSAVIENLPSGIWYFAVKALNTSGLESDFSGEASKTIR